MSIDYNPFRQVKNFKLTEKPPKFMFMEEIERVMSVAESFSKEMHFVYALGIYAGLRRSEIENTRWEWFDLENKIIMIQPYGDFVPKSHRSRPIPMNQKLKYILKPYSEEHGYLLQSYLEESAGGNAQRHDFKNGFKAVKHLASVDWITPHVMRHTSASQLIRFLGDDYPIVAYSAKNARRRRKPNGNTRVFISRNL